MKNNYGTTQLSFIIIIISGFGIYGAAVVPDSGVGNTCHIISDTCGPRLPWPPMISGAWKPQTRDGVNAKLYTIMPNSAEG